MSKKMKGVALDSSPYAVHEDAKTRSKHENLLQEYQELQKEAGDMRNKLEDAKQRKLILLAEVRFLRRRHKYLLKTKSSKDTHEKELTQLAVFEIHGKNGLKDRISSKKETLVHRLPPIPPPKQKKKMHTLKEAAPRKNPAKNLSSKQTVNGGKKGVPHGSTQLSDLDHKKRMCSVKDAVSQNLASVVDLNHNGRIYSGNGTSLLNSAPVFDLNQDNSVSGKEANFPSRAPTFDLNEISTEEEEFQVDSEVMKLEEPKKIAVRGLYEEQHSDLKLSVCRNLGEGTSRVGKRKISWQDPVALRV